MAGKKPIKKAEKENTTPDVTTEEVDVDAGAVEETSAEAEDNKTEEELQAQAEAEEQKNEGEENAPDGIVIDTDEDSDEDDSEVDVDAGAVEASKVNEDKIVKVVTVRDHKCTIGGETYYFKKGVQKKVPLNVKCVLNSAGLLGAL